MLEADDESEAPLYMIMYITAITCSSSSIGSRRIEADLRAHDLLLEDQDLHQ